jgi:hypothetical protein
MCCVFVRSEKELNYFSLLILQKHFMLDLEKQNELAMCNSYFCVFVMYLYQLLFHTLGLRL